jgi:beta-glucanase (GH16 family)
MRKIFLNIITSTGILVLVIFASSCTKQQVNTTSTVTPTITTTTTTTTTSTTTASAPTLDSTKYALVWSDEFSGTAVDAAKWNFETGGGGWGNNEQEYYKAENATVANGNLVITAKREQNGNQLYTSSRMTTANKEEATFGLISARIKMPVGQGLWPAFWMLGSNISTVSWPKCGELDIMEHINTDNKIYGTMHWDGGGGHVQYGRDTTITNAGDYHVYAIAWDQNSINWYVDNKLYATGNIANNINNTAAFHLPFFIVLNFAVGGSWPGQTVDTSLFPVSMYVDYVRVYKAK